LPVALERLDGPAKATAGSASTLQPSFAQNELLWLAGGSLWKVRNEVPEVRNFVVVITVFMLGMKPLGTNERPTAWMKPIPAIA
jgi:hypothetical protein